MLPGGNRSRLPETKFRKTGLAESAVIVGLDPAIQFFYIS
jgi:hypothetical protein